MDRVNGKQTGCSGKTCPCLKTKDKSHKCQRLVSKTQSQFFKNLFLIPGFRNKKNPSQENRTQTLRRMRPKCISKLARPVWCGCPQILPTEGLWNREVAEPASRCRMAPNARRARIQWLGTRGLDAVGLWNIDFEPLLPLSHLDWRYCLTLR